MKLSLIVLTGTLIFSVQSRAEISVSEEKSEIETVKKFSGSSLEQRAAEPESKEKEILVA